LGDEGFGEEVAEGADDGLEAAEFEFVTGFGWDFKVVKEEIAEAAGDSVADARVGFIAGWIFGAAGDGVLVDVGGIKEGLDILMEVLEEGILAGEAGEVEIGLIFMGVVGWRRWGGWGLVRMTKGGSGHEFWEAFVEGAADEAAELGFVE
jgi:hypothetical protein